MKRDYMPIYVDDLLIETRHLSTEEFGAYMLLMMSYWCCHGWLPQDDQGLMNIVGLYGRRKRWLKIKEHIAPLFGPNWTHPKLDIEMKKKRMGGQWGVPALPPNRCQTIEWRATRRRVMKRDNFTCAYCGKRGGKLECDHIVPASRGGTDTDDNLTTACKPCNRAKHARTPEEWRQ